MISYETLSFEGESGGKEKSYPLDADGDYLVRTFLLSG
jgi:hypothetical protein